MATTKEKTSKERQLMEARARQALNGLGIVNKAAEQAIIDETLGKTDYPQRQEQSTTAVSIEPPGSVAPSEPVEARGTPLSPETESSAGERVHLLPVGQLEPSPDQPRVDSEPDHEFLESIRMHGVMNPIHVRPIGQDRYQIISGERRWRACKLLNSATVPALIRSRADDMAAAHALIDNLVRKDLSALEEARAYQQLIKKHGYTRADLAARLGCDRSRITRALRVLELPEPLLQLMLGPSSQMSFSHVEELIPLIGQVGRLERIARQAVEQGWSSARIRAEVTRHPRVNSGAQPVRMRLRGEEGRQGFNMVVRFHANRPHDVPLVEQALVDALQRVRQFKEAMP